MYACLDSAQQEFELGPTRWIIDDMNFIKNDEADLLHDLRAKPQDEIQFLRRDY
jgi:hypothetical protein